MPYFRGDVLDKVIWDWVRTTMQDPKNLVAGLRASQAESEQENQALRQRLSLIESQLREKDGELKRLLDLYLSGAFPKEMLIERKEHREKIVADLERERSDVVSHIQSVLLTDKEIAEIEAWRAEIREGLDAATFEDKQRYFTLLDVRGKLAVENNEKVAYIKCKIGKQRVSLVATSHSQCNLKGTPCFPMTLTARLVIGIGTPVRYEYRR